MLTNQPFYHGIIRKCTVAFAGIFSNIHIRVRDKDGKSQKIVKVPIAYANKDKMLTRLQTNADLKESYLVTLPRASFEILGYNYASERSLNKMVYQLGESDSGDSVLNYSPAPYNIEFALYTYTKATEENLQVMEQILPFFRPDLTLRFDVLQEMGIKQNVPLILNSVNVDEVVEGDFEERRAIITTYNFTMKMNLYGPLYGESDPENHFGTSNGSLNVVKHVIVDVNTGKYTADVVPDSANIDDVFEIIEGWTYE